jgi:hypothetical protein
MQISPFGRTVQYKGGSRGAVLAGRSQTWLMAVLKDIQFWVPAAVLLVGLLFLRLVR